MLNLRSTKSPVACHHYFRVSGHVMKGLCRTMNLRKGSVVLSLRLCVVCQIQSDPTCNIVVIWVKIFKNGKTIEIHLVRLTEVCGKVLSEKYAYKSVKTALLLSNVIDADHQNSCLFTNEGHFSLPSWGLIGVVAKFHE